MSRQAPYTGEIYIEFHPIGRQVKVTAIDASTGVEVVVFGPASTSNEELKRIAVQKLRWRIEQIATSAR